MIDQVQRIAVLAAVLRRLDLFPIEALRRAASAGPFAEQNLSAIEAGALASPL